MENLNEFGFFSGDNGINEFGPFSGDNDIDGLDTSDLSQLSANESPDGQFTGTASFQNGNLLSDPQFQNNVSNPVTPAPSNGQVVNSASLTNGNIASAQLMNTSYSPTSPASPGDATTVQTTSSQPVNYSTAIDNVSGHDWTRGTPELEMPSPSQATPATAPLSENYINIGGVGNSYFNGFAMNQESPAFQQTDGFQNPAGLDIFNLTHDQVMNFPWDSYSQNNATQQGNHARGVHARRMDATYGTQLQNFNTCVNAQQNSAISTPVNQNTSVRQPAIHASANQNTSVCQPAIHAPINQNNSVHRPAVGGATAAVSKATKPSIRRPVAADPITAIAAQASAAQASSVRHPGVVGPVTAPTTEAASVRRPAGLAPTPTIRIPAPSPATTNIQRVYEPLRTARPSVSGNVSSGSVAPQRATASQTPRRPAPEPDYDTIHFTPPEEIPTTYSDDAPQRGPNWDPINLGLAAVQSVRSTSNPEALNPPGHARSENSASPADENVDPNKFKPRFINMADRRASDWSTPKPYPAFANAFRGNAEAARNFRRASRIAGVPDPNIEAVRANRAYWIEQLYNAMTRAQEKELVDSEGSGHRARFLNAHFDYLDIEACCYKIFEKALEVAEKGYTGIDLYVRVARRGKLVDPTKGNVAARLGLLCDILGRCKGCCNDALEGGVALEQLCFNPVARENSKIGNNIANAVRAGRIRKGTEAERMEQLENGEWDQNQDEDGVGESDEEAEVEESPKSPVDPVNRGELLNSARAPRPAVQRSNSARAPRSAPKASNAPRSASQRSNGTGTPRSASKPSNRAKPSRSALQSVRARRMQSTSGDQRLSQSPPGSKRTRDDTEQLSPDNGQDNSSTSSTPADDANQVSPAKRVNTGSECMSTQAENNNNEPQGQEVTVSQDILDQSQYNAVFDQPLPAQVPRVNPTVQPSAPVQPVPAQGTITQDIESQVFQAAVTAGQASQQPSFQVRSAQDPVFQAQLGALHNRMGIDSPLAAQSREQTTQGQRDQDTATVDQASQDHVSVSSGEQEHISIASDDEELFGELFHGDNTPADQDVQEQTGQDEITMGTGAQQQLDQHDATVAPADQQQPAQHDATVAPANLQQLDQHDATLAPTAQPLLDLHNVPVPPDFLARLENADGTQDHGTQDLGIDDYAIQQYLGQNYTTDGQTFAFPEQDQAQDGAAQTTQPDISQGTVEEIQAYSGSQQGVYIDQNGNILYY